MTAPTEKHITIEDLNHFVGLLTKWHESKVKVLEYMLSVPDGTEVVLNDDNPCILSGDLLQGFRIGVTLGLAELGTLPFVAELEDTDAALKH